MSTIGFRPMATIPIWAGGLSAPVRFRDATLKEGRKKANHEFGLAMGLSL
jgi:hypothetical protein